MSYRRKATDRSNWHSLDSRVRNSAQAASDQAGPYLSGKVQGGHWVSTLKRLQLVAVSIRDKAMRARGRLGFLTGAQALCNNELLDALNKHMQLRSTFVH